MYIKVYLILAHKKPHQTEQLIRLLQDGKSLFFIHLDKKVNSRHFLNCEKLDSVQFIKKNVKCDWGKFGLVQASLNSFEEIKNFMNANYIDTDYHCIMMSGEDLPLQSNQNIHEFLKNKRGTTFLHHWELPYSGWWNGGFFRFESLYFFEYNTFKKQNYWLNKLITKLKLTHLIPINRFKKIYPNITFFGASQWMILSKEMIESLLEETKMNRKFVSLFKHVLAPDELYFPMLIHTFLKNKLDSIENCATHLVLFDGHKPNPNYLSLLDLQSNMSDNLLFARKFDENINIDSINYVLQQISK